MKNIIDIHCHIIPGVDDGAPDMEQALNMLKIGVENGVRAMIATPHHHPQRGKKDKEEIKFQFQELKDKAAVLQIPIELYLGNEILYTSVVPQELEEGRLYTLAGSRYILVEFMPESRFSLIREGLNEMNLQGLTPVLAHIERYAALVQDNDRIAELIELGALMQVNMMTLNGAYGKSIQKSAIKWIKKDMVHFIASDSHSCRTRAPRFQEGMDKLCKKLGENIMHKLLIENPKKILENGDII